MTAIDFYLRREETSTNVTEFLYIPLEQISFQGQGDHGYAPLPFVTPDTLGAGSPTIPNFFVDLGRRTINIRVSGTFFPAESSKFPDLSTEFSGLADPRHVYSDSATISSQIDAEQMRDQFTDWWLSQSQSTLHDFRMVWPEWFANGNDREFQGLILDPQHSKEAGVEGQFPWQATFRAGDDGA